jgi:outer membrane protein assembly factor BamE (lipoprotein component of BamABCDE complex)
MKSFVNALAALLLAGCAAFDGHTLKPGTSTEAEVTALMGAPALELKRPNGDRWLYFTRYPSGRATFVATIAPDKALRGIDQRLVYGNIYAVKAGMRTDEVRELLGPPREITRLPRQQRDVWEYPWRHAVRELRMLWVQFSDDGVVREVVEMHDHENDPENGQLP